MPQTLQVTLKITGPIKRSTFSPEAPDPAAESINDLLHWSWSTRLQIRRLLQTTRAEFKAWGMRQRLMSRRRFSASSYDEHIVLIAAANLDRAIRRAPRAVRDAIIMPRESQRALWLLRNIYEHWDELRRLYRLGPGKLKGAALKLKREFPRADPWSCTVDIHAGDIVIADVVSVVSLTANLRKLEANLLRLERRRVSAHKASSAVAR